MTHMKCILIGYNIGTPNKQYYKTKGWIQHSISRTVRTSAHGAQYSYHPPQQPEMPTQSPVPGNPQSGFQGTFQDTTDSGRSCKAKSDGGSSCAHRNAVVDSLHKTNIQKLKSLTFPPHTHTHKNECKQKQNKEHLLISN